MRLYTTIFFAPFHIRRLAGTPRPACWAARQGARLCIFFCESSLLRTKTTVPTKGHAPHSCVSSLLREKPQYPTMGHATHSGREPIPLPLAAL